MADIAVVVAGDDVFAVELDDASDRPPAEAAMDGTRVLSWLTLDEARATRIGGAALATEILDRGAVGASAEILGGSDRVLEMAVQYAKDRVQFDQPIGSFQAIKHRCADMLVDVEGMRSSTWYGAWAISAGDPDEVGGGVDGQGVVVGRRQAGDGVGTAGARRHRVHLGARPPSVHETVPVRPAQATVTPSTTGNVWPGCCGPAS